jgi:hypothetical protein
MIPWAMFASRGCQITFTLSASIAFYRPQATMFAGICDGKSRAQQNEVVFVQVLIGAGDD